eukprot:TRINITY_DN680_c0_g1_i1.p1 TRINITY_DN680_c0_g1~~TRINITY_DN680_c0_g1_i1.p1  ORF type:complete len:234 (+),score=45.55 TRINITY_DN680_c0_g1_i1:181-882(+)
MKRAFNSTPERLEKRIRKEVPNPHSISRTGPVFNVLQVAPQTTNDSFSEDPCVSKDGDKRVGVSARVNFSKLNPTEQKLRFINQAEEIKRLRAKLKGLSKKKRKITGKDFQVISDDARDSNHDFLYQTFDPNQRHFLKSVARSVITERLKPGTLPFNQIATILRDLLDLDCSNRQYVIKLPEKTIPISRTEHEEYRKVPCTCRFLRNILGREQREAEDPNELLKAMSLARGRR